MIYFFTLESNLSVYFICIYVNIYVYFLQNVDSVWNKYIILIIHFMGIQNILRIHYFNVILRFDMYHGKQYIALTNHGSYLWCDTPIVFKLFLFWKLHIIQLLVGNNEQTSNDKIYFGSVINDLIQRSILCFMAYK